MNISRQVVAGMDQSIILNENRRKLKTCLFWGSMNVLLFAILLYDIMHTCPITVISFILYLEYTLCVIFLLNVIYYFFRYINISLNTTNLTVDMANRTNLSNANHFDPNYTLVSNSPMLLRPVMYENSPSTSFSKTPLNSSANSWRGSFNDSQNYNTSISPSPYSYIRPSQYSPYEHRPSLCNISSSSIPQHDNSGNDFIHDEHSLTEYLKGYQNYEKTDGNNTIGQPTSLLSSFWSHPAAKNNVEVSPLLGKCQYQLSPISPGSSSSSPTGKSNDSGSSSNVPPFGIETWRRFQVDTVTLIQWNANIRMWLSQTILERLLKEIESIDDALQKHGLLDVRIGAVGLDRLRKVAQMGPTLHFIPTLSTLIPFLELSTNQEYLVKRIRELAKGGCMSAYKWNGGTSFNGKEWNDSLPTDSAIIMHMFVTYMDTQLLPLPSKPDVKPFTGNHFIKFNDKMPVLSGNSTLLAIHQFNEKPPHYRVIVHDEILDVVKGYNNLFHSILLFVYQVNKKEHGMLGRIYLGRSGINILWVIDS